MVLGKCDVFEWIVSYGDEGAFSYYGPSIWNGLPYSLRCLTDIEQFKQKLKSYYFNIAFEGVP